MALRVHEILFSHQLVSPILPFKTLHKVGADEFVYTSAYTSLVQSGLTEKFLQHFGVYSIVYLYSTLNNKDVIVSISIE